VGYVVEGVRLFLVWVLLASAWSKRGSDWPARLAAYRLMPEAVSLRLAWPIALAEVMTAAVMLALGQTGLVAGGLAFLVFGAVLSLARAQGFRGNCGCSRTGRVSWLAATRSLGWGTAALALGISAQGLHPNLALVETASSVLVVLVAVWTVLLMTSSGRVSSDATR
jgi:hypothetical protein